MITKKHVPLLSGIVILVIIGCAIGIFGVPEEPVVEETGHQDADSLITVDIGEFVPLDSLTNLFDQTEGCPSHLCHYTKWPEVDDGLHLRIIFDVNENIHRRELTIPDSLRSQLEYLDGILLEMVPLEIEGDYVSTLSNNPYLLRTICYGEPMCTPVDTLESVDDFQYSLGVRLEVWDSDPELPATWLFPNAKEADYICF